MKKLIRNLLSCTLVLSTLSAATVFADTYVSVYVNGTKLNFTENDVLPCVISNRTYVPIRKICEALEITVDWDSQTGTLTFERDGVVVQKMNTSVVSVDGNTVSFDTPSINMEDRILMPIRMLAESLGAKVTWDAQSSGVYITIGGLDNSDSLTINDEEKNTSGSDRDNSTEDYAYMGFEALNEYREQNGVPKLNYNADLCKAAQKHAEDMVKNDYFSHESLDGRIPRDRAEEFTTEFTTIGENIAYGSKDAYYVVNEMWANSEGHNANMLNCGYTDVGIGYYDGFWVQLFGG